MPRVREERLRDRLLSLAGQLSPVLVAVSLAGWILLFALDRGTPPSPLCLSYMTLTGTMEGLLSDCLRRQSACCGDADVAGDACGDDVTAADATCRAVVAAQPRARKPTRRGLVVLGYFAVWMTAGFALLTIAAALGLFAALGLPALTIAAALAALWQAGPLRQRALNRCHRVPQMSASGAKADRDCIRFGVTHGLWCAATCSPLMLLPLTSPAFHLPLMFVVSAWLVLERTLPPRRPSWTFRILPGQAVAVTLLKSIR